MLRTFLWFATLLVLKVAFAQNTSSIDFVIKNFGVNVDGHFSTFEITTKFNADNELIDLSGKIQVNSIITGIESRDNHLLKADYFDVTNHEFITFKDFEIKRLSAFKYSIKAEVTIKGKTNKIEIPLEVSQTPKHYKMISNFEINRKDFDIGGSSLVMSKTVKVTVIHYQLK